MHGVATTAGNRRAASYLSGMSRRTGKRGVVGQIAILAPLFAILVAALWFAARAWTAVQGPPMPAVGYVAMTLGVIFSLVVGFRPDGAVVLFEPARLRRAAPRRGRPRLNAGAFRPAAH